MAFSKARQVIKKLSEQANSKKRAIDKLDAHQFNIAIHLILLFSFPKGENARGWKKELNAWRRELIRFNNGKGPKDNFSSAMLRKAFWIEPLEEPSDRAMRIKEILQDKNIVVPSLEDRVDEFKLFVFSYIDSIINDRMF